MVIYLLCFLGAERRKSSLNKRVSQLEEACRAKEAERVDLELRLTQVQENLKKSLAGGALGAPVEGKPPIKVHLRVKYKFTPTCFDFFYYLYRCASSLCRPLAKRSRTSTVSPYL